MRVDRKAGTSPNAKIVDMPMAAITARTVPSNGVSTTSGSGDAGAKELSTHRIRLEAGKEAIFKLEGEEAVVVLQEGRGTFAASGERWSVSRAGVFSERATAVYLPVAAELAVLADTPLEAVAFSTPAPAESSSRRRRPRRWA